MRPLTKGSRGVSSRLALLVLSIGVLIPGTALAHDVTPGDAGYIQEIWGVHIIPFMYLGAKHMVTGYDHILFLFGVIFFLYRMKDIAIYVSLFALGHSLTMIAGVMLNFGINAFIIDAIIGLSIVYKALDNLGAYQRWFGYQPNTKAVTFLFGLCHGFGLASKVIEYNIAEDGLLPNLIAFNVGVEVASGSHVLVLDADERLAPGMQSNLLRAARDPGPDVPEDWTIWRDLAGVAWTSLTEITASMGAAATAEAAAVTASWTSSSPRTRWSSRWRRRSPVLHRRVG